MNNTVDENKGTTINVALVGATGRMGLEIAHLATSMTNIRIVEAFDKPSSKHLGTPLQELLTNIQKNRDNIPDNIPPTVIVSSLPTPESATTYLKSVQPNSMPHVLVDFTSPEGTIANINTYHALRIPVVIGSTGTDQQLHNSIAQLSTKIPVFYSANMSMGIHIMKQLTTHLAQLATLTQNTGTHTNHNNHEKHEKHDESSNPTYDFEVIEAHHNRKQDAPSGTAVMLAQTIIDNFGDNNQISDRAKYSRHGDNTKRTPYEVGVQSIRGGSIVGEHTVMCIGNSDRIEITHRASSRRIFAEGALQAAAWLALQHRNNCPNALYTMDDLLPAQR